jgi:hypothetical protein
MHAHGSPPRARQDGLLVETVGEELLLYDQNSHTAHCLSPIAACVWRHCDGERDVTELAQLAGVSKSLIADALHELREKDLLDAESQLMQSTVPDVSRREAIFRVARVGAAAAAAPLIVSATAATPAMAVSNVKCKGGSCVSPRENSTCCCCEKGCVTKSTIRSCATECSDASFGPLEGEQKEAACA